MVAPLRPSSSSLGRLSLEGGVIAAVGGGLVETPRVMMVLARPKATSLQGGGGSGRPGMRRLQAEPADVDAAGGG